MNHLLRALLTVGLSSVAVLVILLSADHSGPYAQMDTFVRESVRSLGREVTIEQYVEASLPRNFRRDMSRASFGGPGPYSWTQRSTLWHPISATDLVMTYTIQQYGGNMELLPYPPEDLWCVKLKSTDPIVPRAVLIALHQDMYTARWRVHEPYDAEAVLAAVGCYFSNK